MIQDLDASIRVYMKRKPEGGFYVDEKTTPAEALRELREASQEYEAIQGEPLLEFRK